MRQFLLQYYRRTLHKLFSTNAATNPAPSTSSGWAPVVGLEIHAQIACNSKLFSGSSSDNFAPLNSVVSHFDCALPGTLPILNRRCVEAGVLTALALNCRINYVSRFDRKHYFYADLPSGYQITQHSHPIANEGFLDFYVFEHTGGKQDFEPYKIRTKVLQVQLEQDSGKSLLDDKNNRTLIDLNRAGCGLMEIIFDHNLNSGLEAACLILELVAILRSLDTCECKMEKGQFRVDANVSVHKPGQVLGTRTEVKNLNSVRFVRKAVDFEINRQINLLEQGREIVNETRTFDFRTGTTIPMRDKEVRQDYRYMPEPNLPPLHLYSKTRLPPSDLDPDSVIYVDQIREQMPVLSSAVKKNWLEVHKISLKTVLTLEQNGNAKNFFSECIRLERPSCDLQFIAEQIIKVQKWLDLQKLDFAKSKLKPEIFIEVCQLYKDKIITEPNFLKVLKCYVEGEKRIPNILISEKNMTTITDPVVIENACDEMLSHEEESLKAYKKGKKQILKRYIRLADEKLNQCVPLDELELIILRKISEK